MIGGFQNYTQSDNSLDLCDILCSIYLFIVFTKIVLILKMYL